MDKTSADRRLRAATIRLAYEKPELRPYLLPLLKEADGPSMADMMSRKWDGGKTFDDEREVIDSIPYNIHNGPVPAGANGSTQRDAYNEWYRKNVCTKRPDNCGIGKKR